MGAQPCSDRQVRSLRALVLPGAWLELSDEAGNMPETRCLRLTVPTPQILSQDSLLDGFRNARRRVSAESLSWMSDAQNPHLPSQTYGVHSQRMETRDAWVTQNLRSAVCTIGSARSTAASDCPKPAVRRAATCSRSMSVKGHL